MTGITTMLRKELKCFRSSGAGTFLIYGILSVVWSLMLLTSGSASGGSGASEEARSAGLWFIFFSVIISANFSSAVFISERVNGTLDILITSGLSRSSVLFGKMLFIIIMTSAIGAACVALAVVWGFVLPADVLAASGAGAGGAPIRANDAALYLSTTCLNAAVSAYLSVRMSNPRFLHFINLLMVAVFVAVYTAVSDIMYISPAVLTAGFLLTAVIFTLLAKREFAGERVVRPVIF